MESDGRKTPFECKEYSIFTSVMVNDSENFLFDPNYDKSIIQDYLLNKHDYLRTRKFLWHDLVKYSVEGNLEMLIVALAKLDQGDLGKYIICMHP